MRSGNKFRMMLISILGMITDIQNNNIEKQHEAYNKSRSFFKSEHLKNS